MSKIRICDFCGLEIKQGDMFASVSVEFQSASPYISSDNDFDGDFHVGCYENVFLPAIERIPTKESRK